MTKLQVTLNQQKFTNDDTSEVLVSVSWVLSCGFTWPLYYSGFKNASQQPVLVSESLFQYTAHLITLNCKYYIFKHNFSLTFFRVTSMLFFLYSVGIQEAVRFMMLETALDWLIWATVMIDILKHNVCWKFSYV